MNYKGLLASREDQSVDHVKPAYVAAQRVFAIFDDSLDRVTNFACTASTTRSLAASAYANKQTGGQVVALWFKDAMPSDSNDRTLGGPHLLRGTIRRARLCGPAHRRGPCAAADDRRFPPSATSRSTIRRS